MIFATCDCDAHRGPQKSRDLRDKRKQCCIAIKAAMEVASDCDFGLRFLSPKPPSFCGNSGDLAPSTRKSLAIAIVRFGALRRRCLGHHLSLHAVAQDVRTKQNQEGCPEDPSVLKIVRRADSLRREQKRYGDIARRYGECSEVLVFLRKRGRKTAQRVKNYPKDPSVLKMVRRSIP